MNKILSIFFALIYMGTSSGLALQVHYCMDKITGMSLVEHEKKACDKCGMDKASNSCCKDEFKFVKLQDSHKLFSSTYQLDPPVTDIHHLYFEKLQPFINQVNIKEYASHSPPGETTSLNILHCVFRV